MYLILINKTQLSSFKNNFLTNFMRFLQQRKWLQKGQDYIQVYNKSKENDATSIY